MQPRPHVLIDGSASQRLVDVRSLLVTASVLMLLLVGAAWSHGRLVDPPSRSSMWRYGFNSPPNYNDMELFCGGFRRQWVTNGGKCGICGDPWDASDPKPNEIGGKYARRGTVVRTYGENSTRDMIASVQLTANHNGHFEFRVCPYDDDDDAAVNSVVTEVTQECLDSHQLELQDGSGTWFQVPTGSGNGMFQVPLRLPSDLSCDRCLFQWIYKAANNWGHCEDGSSRVGCGPQEQFRACADIRIVGRPTDPASTVNTAHRPAEHSDRPVGGSSGDAERDTDIQSPNLEVDDGVRSTQTIIVQHVDQSVVSRPDSRRNCSGAGVWVRQPGMRDWCLVNCNHTPPYCPPSHCICDDN